MSNETKYMLIFHKKGESDNQYPPFVANNLMVAMEIKKRYDKRGFVTKLYRSVPVVINMDEISPIDGEMNHGST